MAKIVFMGTPDFAVPTLQALYDNHTLLAVVTQPDRRSGRGGDVHMSPVKVLTQSLNVPVLQPEKIRRPEAIDELRQYEADAYVVAAFGQILPQALLDIPPFGSINVHASLLPRWRGAAPIHAAIRAGDPETGVTIMKMDAGLDTGPILSMRAVSIEPDETAQSLHDKLAQVGADLLIETLPPYFSGELQPQPQPEVGVTYAPMIKKAEGEIDWNERAANIERLVRAFQPWPGTYTFWDGKLLKIHRGDIGAGELATGTVDEVDGRVAIGTGKGLFFPLELQLEGKRSLPVDDFVRGREDFIGARLGAE